MSGAGGTHHAFAGRGEGFCVFCDIAVAALAAMEEEGIERILVIDLDVHQASIGLIWLPCTCCAAAVLAGSCATS
jgi:hypothetical protein